MNMDRHAPLPPMLAARKVRGVAAADPLSLAPARVHEAQGRGRRAFALFQAARHPGPLVWITPAHMPERPMPRGLPAGVAERLLLLTPKAETDLLWSMEEALRAAPVGLVIAEPEKPLSLTAGRRLQLAAEAGQTTGLILIREGLGSNATETRWACEMVAGAVADSTLHNWSLIKNKKGTLGDWRVDWNGTAAAFDLVSETGQRCKPAQPPG
jgi:protein ImuA